MKLLHQKTTGFLFFSGLLLTLIATTWADDMCSGCHNDPEADLLSRSHTTSPKAVGVLDKGQLQVNTDNFGDLANFHVWFTNAAHWPRNASSVRQYAFGLGLVVAVNDTNVIETLTQSMTRVQDWLPLDDAFGHQFSGEITAVSDDTPFMASSDFRETWPLGYYDDGGYWVDTEDRYWPGYFRIDVTNPDFPDTLVERMGEFTSDRDAYCIYNDDYNTQGRVGIEVEQTAYSYGRPYAEDVIFWDFNIYNTSGSDLEDIYLGFIAKFRPDYDNHDYLNFIDSDGDGIRDLVYVYDLDNQASGTWADTNDPLGMVGLRIYDTPGQIGITDFHHFSRGVTPDTDEKIWALMVSDPTDTDLVDPDYYFHGSDPHFDSTEADSLEAFYPLWLDEETGVELGGDAINFIVSCGPVSIPADSVVKLSLGLIMGDAGTVPMQPDTTDLMANVRIANEMYQLYFQGSGPPDPPVVHAVPGAEKVTLYWNSEPSESAVDVLTGVQDFEGYKVFRSTDRGLTWGDEITDIYGNLAGYVPIAIFDKIDAVEGADPAYPQHLGYNTGLTHTFTDSNLVDGLEYWYCVSAYDRGNQNPDSLEQSYLYPLGASVFEQHTVSAVPGVPANNISEPLVPEGNLAPLGGDCDGTVSVEIVEPEAVTGHGYKITFSQQVVLSVNDADTTYGYGFTLVDTTLMDTLFRNHPLTDESGDNLPVVDGMRLKIRNSQSGVKSLGWTKVSGDTCTFDWRYESIDPGSGSQMIQGDVSTFDDWKIIVDYDGGSDVAWFDAFLGDYQSETQHVPIRVENIADPDNPVDVSASTTLCEFAIPAPPEYRSLYYSPLGWDLEPGGLGYLHGSPGWYEKHVDFFILEKIDTTAVGDTIPNYMFLFTNNKPDTSWTVNGDMEIIDAAAPSDGDEFTIRTYKPFRESISYSFGTTAGGEPLSGEGDNPLRNLRVVPDPYVVTNAWETSEFGKKLQFRNLPDRCTIKIYTLAGERIATVEHNAPTGYEFWNMRTRNDQFIAPGTYLYYAATADGYSTQGRFLVIR
ncbi:MAG: hypothetical protein GXO91_04120 [FCB group bacterium]|nr:hypothetical protein [FCB group bacterium]